MIRRQCGFATASHRELCSHRFPVTLVLLCKERLCQARGPHRGRSGQLVRLVVGFTPIPPSSIGAEKRTVSSGTTCHLCSPEELHEDAHLLYAETRLLKGFRHQTTLRSVFKTPPGPSLPEHGPSLAYAEFGRYMSHPGAKDNAPIGQNHRRPTVGDS